MPHGQCGAVRLVVVCKQVWSSQAAPHFRTAAALSSARCITCPGPCIWCTRCFGGRSGLVVFNYPDPAAAHALCPCFFTSAGPGCGGPTAVSGRSRLMVWLVNQSAHSSQTLPSLQDLGVVDTVLSVANQVPDSTLLTLHTDLVKSYPTQLILVRGRGRCLGVCQALLASAGFCSCMKYALPW